MHETKLITELSYSLDSIPEGFSFIPKAEIPSERLLVSNDETDRKKFDTSTLFLRIAFTIPAGIKNILNIVLIMLGSNLKEATLVKFSTFIKFCSMGHPVKKRLRPAVLLMTHLTVVLSSCKICCT